MNAMSTSAPIIKHPASADSRELVGAVSTNSGYTVRSGKRQHPDSSCAVLESQKVARNDISTFGENSAELVPVTEPLFHQWRCRAGGKSSAFLRGVLQAPETKEIWQKVIEERKSREETIQKIHRTFKAGELLCRGVNLKRSTPHSCGLEPAYQENRPQPRPGTLLAEGLRASVFRIAELHLGLHPVKELYNFKKDVRSFTGITKDSNPRALQPNNPCLLNKLMERENRQYSVYPPRTSGHLNQDGTYTSGHNKPLTDDERQWTHETIIQGYRKDQYQCVILPYPLLLGTIHDVLETKVRLEKKLGISELPLAIYDEKSGNMREVFYLSDLGIYPKDLPEMKANISKLQQFVECTSYLDLDTLLLLATPSLLLSFLQRTPPDIASSIRMLKTPYRQALLHAVKKGNLARVKLLKEHGANLAAHYCVYNPRVQIRNLLQVFVWSDYCSHSPLDMCKSHPEKLSEQTQLGILLYDAGCRTRVDDTLMQKLPSLAIYMLSKGEPYYDKGFVCDNLLGLLQLYLARGAISSQEFETAIGYFNQKPEKMDALFTQYTCEKLTDSPFSSERLPNIHAPSDLSGLTTAEEIDAVIPVLLAHGITADTAVLKTHLNKKREEECKALIWMVPHDKQVIEAIFEEYTIQSDPERCEYYPAFLDHNLFKFGMAGFQGLHCHPLEWVTRELKSRTMLLKEQAATIARHIVDNNRWATLELTNTLLQQTSIDLKAKQKAIEAYIEKLESEQSTPEVQNHKSMVLKLTTDHKTASSNATIDESTTSTFSDFGWLNSLFNTKASTQGKCYRELAQFAIRQYYLCPHSGQAESLVVRKKKVPDPLKEQHGADHVTRTQVLTEALLELFERHTILLRRRYSTGAAVCVN